MSLFIASLNSGSNGNCYYVGNESDAILVDAGISCRETEKRMTRLGLEMSKLRAIFVSHEHSDHITGIPGISKKFQLPVYITPPTFRDSRIPIQEHLVKTLLADTPVQIGALAITAFVKCHDAIDPHSFVVSDGTTQVGVFTDIGNCCAKVTTNFGLCHAVFLESNYCADMLEKGNYPYYLKRRISGEDGHLSNTQALDLFVKHRGSHLTHLILSHLSKNNNDPALVERLFREKAGETAIVVASRYAETAIYTITGSKVNTVTRKTLLRESARVQQLFLFDLMK